MAKFGGGRGSGERLKRYWVLSPEGRAKWHTFTELHAHLAKYIHDPEKLDRTTSQWFHDRYGIWAGSDLNRVRTGHRFRGKRIGPG